MEEDPDMPPSLMTMFIISSDTLRGRKFDQKLPSEWKDRPPLFDVVPTEKRRWRQQEQQEEDPMLLKGMVRKGIPPSLRCALWLSNVIQSSHPHQNPKIAHEYRTLAKVRVLDHAYDGLWQGANAPLSDVDSKKDFNSWITFGHDKLLNGIQDVPPSGRKSLQRVLYALEFVLGFEYAPMIPTIAILFLSVMSESYAFTCIREMAHHSSWYWPCSIPEQVAHERAFLDILSRLHPQTASTMEGLGIGERFAKAMFRDFFLPILPEHYVFRIVDIYTLEGCKVLFRFGVALAVLFHKEWKGDTGNVNSNSNDVVSGRGDTEAPPLIAVPIPNPEEGENWWKSLTEWTHSTRFSFDFVVKKAYGVHGKGVRKRYRFPRRPILARILRLEEERYIQQQLRSNDGLDQVNKPSVRPLGLVPTVQCKANQNLGSSDAEPASPNLAEPAFVRAKLAQWLPPSLRLTKLDLIYSTNVHGRTLESFYRHCQTAKHTILLLEVLGGSSTIQAVGMYASQTWKPSTKVYGDGECFLFRILKSKPEESKCWKWSPREDQIRREDVLEEDTKEANNKTALLEQFQVGTKHYISMGGNPDGSSGLRLNEDLTRAESSPAVGFDNEPLALTVSMFEVGLVEVYQMVRQVDGIPIK